MTNDHADSRMNMRRSNILNSASEHVSRSRTKRGPDLSASLHREDFVHDLGTRCNHWPELAAVYNFGGA